VNEARITARLQHPAIVNVHEAGRLPGGEPFYAMKRVVGRPLSEVIVAAASLDERLALLPRLLTVAEAIAYAHGEGIVHRDLKPQNIMFRANHRLALLDFGLARELDATATLTQKGMVMATPLYMSPEQCLGQPHDARGDLYAAGVILYEMLTGKHLYEGDNASALAYQHVHGEIPKLPHRLAGYQPILARLIAKRPGDRFQSARELFNHIVH